MRGATPLPLWAVALVLAALAPFAARIVANAFERAARMRSRRLLERADVVDEPARTD